MNRILTGFLVLVPITFLMLVLANRPSKPDDLASCFKLTIPPEIKVVQKEIPAPDHTNYWYQLSNCSESFYGKLLAHSEQVGSKDEQRQRAMNAFTSHDLDFSPAGPEACEANLVGVASYSAAMFYSPRDRQAVIFIDTY